MKIIKWLTVLGFLVYLSIGAVGPSTQEQKKWSSNAERYEKNGWIYLHIEGEPRQRGYQHGYLLAREIAEALRVYREVWKHMSGMDWAELLAKSRAMITPKVDPENLAEIDGIVEGMGAAGIKSDRHEMVAYNAWIELVAYWWPIEKKRISAESPNRALQGCSSFIATGSMTADKGIVLAHNTMGPYVEGLPNVIMDIAPVHGHRILWQAPPGWIHSGTDFFITDAGLVGSETTIGGFSGFDEQQIPEFVRMRRATQDASSINEWVEIIKRGNNGGYANSWLIGDTKTNEIARLELGLKYVGLERTRDGYYAGSNIAENLKLLRFETDTQSDDIRSSNVARRVRWKELMKQYAGKINVDLAERLLADHYDTWLQKENPGSRTLCGHGDLDPQIQGHPMAIPFEPGGTFDGKVVDSSMAKRMSFVARIGAACGMPFNAEKFLDAHPQFDWMTGLLKSRNSQPWTIFQASTKR